MKVYPVFLHDLGGRRAVVFGGGHEAARKALELVDCGADVQLVAAEACPELCEAAASGRLTWHRREYREGDLNDTFLAISTDQPDAIRTRIHDEAARERVLLNTMDDVPRSSFIAGSVVRRGLLTIAISTAGAAPALAVRLRQRLERELGPEYATFLDWAAGVRDAMLRRWPDFDERRRRWYALVDSRVLALLRAGRRDAARREAKERLGVAPL